MVRWKLEDNTGKVHTYMLKNTYLIPKATTRGFVLQHLAQQAQDNNQVSLGQESLRWITWIQRKYKKTLLLDTKLNVKTVAGFKVSMHS